MKILIWRVSMVNEKGTDKGGRNTNFVCEDSEVGKYIERLSKLIHIPETDIFVSSSYNLKFKPKKEKQEGVTNKIQFVAVKAVFSQKWHQRWKRKIIMIWIIIKS